MLTTILGSICAVISIFFYRSIKKSRTVDSPDIYDKISIVLPMIAGIVSAVAEKFGDAIIWLIAEIFMVKTIIEKSNRAKKDKIS